MTLEVGLGPEAVGVGCPDWAAAGMRGGGLGTARSSPREVGLPV